MAAYKNVAKTVQFVLIDTTGALSGATPSAFVSHDKSNYVASTNAPAAVGGAVTGTWSLDLTAAEMNGDTVHVIITATSCVPIPILILTEEDYTQQRAMNLDVLNGLVAAIWAATTRTLSSYGTLTTDTATAVWTAGTRTLTSFGTLAASVATSVWGAGTRTLTALTSGLADEVWNRVRAAVSRPAGSFGNYLDSSVSGVSTGGVSAATIAAAVWNEALASHTTAGTYGVGVPLQLTQVLPHTGLTVNTIGRALQIARAYGHGKRFYDHTLNLETIYDTDNVTIVAQFTLTPSGGPYTGRSAAAE